MSYSIPEILMFLQQRYVCYCPSIPAKFGCNKTQRTQIVMLNCVCELFTSHNVRDTMHAVRVYTFLLACEWPGFSLHTNLVPSQSCPVQRVFTGVFQPYLLLSSQSIQRLPDWSLKHPAKVVKLLNHSLLQKQLIHIFSKAFVALNLPPGLAGCFSNDKVSSNIVTK